MKFIVSFVLLALAVAPFEAKSLRAITDGELAVVSKSLHDSDVNGLVLELDLQGRTTAGSPSDMASNRLIKSDPTSAFSKPTYAAAIALMNNFQRNVTIEETLTDLQLAEQTAFIDAVMETTVMKALHEFLISKGEVNADVATFKQTLNNLWFGRYSNAVSGVKSTSGWEHANVGEKSEKNEVLGFHSWIYLFNEEEDGDCNYLGYINSKSTGGTTIVQAPVELYGGYSPTTEFNVGASPELELALGTLCFYARPDANCVVQGSNGSPYTMETRTLTVNGVTYIVDARPLAV